MPSYSLNSLLKIRERNKIAAETLFKEALDKHSVEKKKLEAIEHSLRHTILVRTKIQDSFFHRAQIHSCNKREVSCHIYLRDKYLVSENNLRKDLLEQELIMNEASQKLEYAKSSVTDATRNLKIVERHFALWQKRKKRAEVIQIDNENDDLNGTRYIIKRPNCVTR